MAGLFPLVVGLGNPGEEYRRTRHNFGFDVLDLWAGQEGIAWKRARFAHARTGQAAGGVWLVQPLSYMNLSGAVVADCLRWFKLPPERMLVVVDDVSLPLGRLRLRAAGSCGGHNGLRSIEAAVGTRGYPRLRGGVGAAEPEKNLSRHVLERFSREEEQEADKMKQRAVEAIRVCETEGLEAAMSRVNGKL